MIEKFAFKSFTISFLDEETLGMESAYDVTQVETG